MTEPDTADEIALIEHELEILRERLAGFVYWGRVLRVAVILGGIVTALLLMALVVRGFDSDPLAVGVAFGVVIITGALLWFLAREPSEDRRNVAAMRYGKIWTDLAAPHPRFVWNSRYVSEAHAIEEMIATREMRLAELRGAA